MRESERPGKVIEYLMLAGNVFLGLVVLELIVHGLVAVSYTHLTLPTKLEV